MATDPRPELLTLADDEAVVWRGAEPTVFDGLTPDAEVDLDGHVVRTLPRRGDLLARVATVNDVHFGETICGHIDGLEWATFSAEPGEPPYPETMNAGAVADITGWEPDAVVAKGDLTSNGTQEEYDRFLEVYGGAFGDRLVHVRGNHESYHGLHAAAWPTQERVLDGVVLAVLDTSRDGVPNGHLSDDQLDWLDELGARADRPVLVFGHHPTWNPEERPNRDETFSLSADHSEALARVFGRRARLLGYFAGHTHRAKVTHLPDAPGVPFVEVPCVKDYPGSWAEYRVYDGLVLQVHRRITAPAALAWTERTRGMFDGTYPAYARGTSADRCFAMYARS
ncbi:MAG: metallophosphoesterase family protein [Microthrixaceae bacterium]